MEVKETQSKTLVAKEYKELGPISFEEKSILIVFFLAAVLWVFRNDINIGILTMPGWSRLLPYPDLIDDGTVAIAMAIILFLIPTRSKGVKSLSIIDVNVFKKIPWDIVLLFGGGFALVAAE